MEKVQSKTGTSISLDEDKVQLVGSEKEPITLKMPTFDFRDGYVVLDGIRVCAQKCELEAIDTRLELEDESAKFCKLTLSMFVRIK